MVDTGASGRFLGCALIPGLEDVMTNYEELDPPQPITTADHNTLHGKGQGALRVLAKDGKGLRRRVKTKRIIVPRLGRHLFSIEMAYTPGVDTIICDRPRIEHSEFAVGLWQEGNLNQLDLKLDREYCATSVVARGQHQLTPGTDFFHTHILSCRR